MIKLIATDIDGTLVKDSTPEIYPEMLDAIRDWTDRGGYFCVASGRQYYSIRHMFKEVADRIIYLAENGAHVRYKGQDILVQKMRRDYVEQIMAQLRQYYDGCDVVVSATEGSLLETHNERFLKFFTEGYHNKYRIVEDVLSTGGEIIKIAIYQEGSIRKLGENVLIPQWQDKVKTCMAGEEWVDFMDASVDKGNALRVIQEYLGVTADETMAFGDNDNDIGMLSAAGESYAVENARESVKAQAKYVCPSYHEKGVYRIIAALLDETTVKRSGMEDKMYDEKVLQCFLEKQEQLYPEPVAETLEEAEDFLEECMAVVVDSVREVWEFFEEEGIDTEDADEEGILEADEVFEIGDGRYLIVEG